MTDLNQNETSRIISEDDDRPSALKRFWIWLFPGGFWGEFKYMFKFCMGFTFVQFCQTGIQPIAVIFGGHLGKIELDTVALSTSLINISGQWVVIGTATACDTLFSQTYGSENKKLLGVLLQRALVIHSLILVPCLVLHLNIEWVLRFLGQDHEVAHLTGRYLTIFLPALFCMYAYEVLRKYLQCQGRVYPHVVIGFIGLCCHILFQYLFVWHLRWDLDGSSLAQVLGYIVMITLTISYILVTKVYKETWDGWTLDLFDEWKEFSKLAFYGMLMICLEWWTFEATILLAGAVGRTELGAQSIIFNVDQIFHLTPCQISVAIAIRVGHHLGAGDPIGARSASFVGSTIAVVSCVAVAVVCIVCRYMIPLIFTNEMDVVNMTAEVLPIVSVFYLADSFGVVVKGICRGGARQGVATVINFLGFCVFAFPLGCCLLFMTDLGIKGLWIGLGSGLWLQDILFFLYLKFRMSWDELAIEARERAKVDTELTINKDNTQSKSDEKEKTPILELRGAEGESAGKGKKKRKYNVFAKLMIILGFVIFLIIGIIVRLSVPVPEEFGSDMCSDPEGNTFSSGHLGHQYHHFANVSVAESITCNTRPRHLLI